MYKRQPWYGVFAPAGTPKAIVAQLQTAIHQVLDTPDVREKLAGIGCEPLKIGPEPLAALIRKELPRWAKVVKEADVTLVGGDRFTDFSQNFTVTLPGWAQAGPERA